MTHNLRIGSAIDPVDPYWVQVRVAAYERAEQLPFDLISISLVEYPETLSQEKQMALLEELLALELDALIAWSLPEELAYSIPQYGIPLILLSEINLQHPLLISPLGLYDIAQSGGRHLVQKLAGQGRVLALGGLVQIDWQNDAVSWAAGLRDAFHPYPDLAFSHIPTPWVYEQIYPKIHQTLQRFDGPLDAIFGLSDTVALAGGQVARELGLINPAAPIVGIGGTPAALAAITDGLMTATVEILTNELGRQAVDLAYQAAQGQPLPPHFEYKSRLVTLENVAEVAARKLVTIANLPNQLVGVRRRQQQERFKQLETSLEISRRVGAILDYHQLSGEIADLIRANYGYDQVQIFHWLEEEQVLELDESAQTPAGQTRLALTGSGVLGQTLRRNEAIFIPDTRRSPRFPPDPLWPNTRSRVVLPIHLGGQVVGLLDLHSDQSTLRARQELVGLQSLADQLGIAMSNARLYGEAVNARAAAEKADQLKTRLLANVSHELRTPLNTILGYVQTVLAAPNSYKVDLPWNLRKDLQHVYHSADHLLHIINDLLDLARAEIGELSLSPELIDPRPFLQEVFDTMAGDATSPGAVNWQLQLPARLPAIQADPVRLRQILLNLLSNARKFTEQGCITLAAEVTPPHLHVWVQDSGPGIPVEQQERIFEPFVTSETVKRRREGIGLGLSITRQLVALHHGLMTLESQPGQGSTFHIYLPLPSFSEQPLPVLSASAQRVLLLVSAQVQPAREIINLSQQQGLAVHCLQPGDDIDAVLRQVQPAALTWDLANASPEDWLVVQRLRHHPRLSHLPFMLYGPAGPDETAALGLTNLVTKPVNAKTLLEAVNTLRPASTLVGPILIVDDDPQACELYQNMVVKTLPGYPVQTAGDGMAALATMTVAPPSLVILDLMMPGLDGFEVLERMRANPRTRSVPVLILSGRMLTFEDIKRLESHGRTTFQSKEVLSDEETVAILQRMLAGDDILPPHTSALVKRTLAYFHQNYDQPLSRQQIADAIGVSKNYLSHIFRRELGLSPWDYLNRYRIKQAKELLSRTTESVTDVALKVGFDNPAYFSRVFHQHTGQSPSAYRENAC